MSRASRPNRRLRRIRFALGFTAVGLVVLTTVGYRLQLDREADLRNSAEAVTLSSLAAVPEDAPALPFPDVAAELGIHMRHGPGPRTRILPEDTGSGLAWADIDCDEDFDLYLVNFPDARDPSAATGEAAWNRLFRNRGDGVFDEVAADLGVADPLWSVASAWGDFDRDGLLDLYVTNYLDFDPDLGRSNTDGGGFDPNWQGIPATLNPIVLDPQSNRLYRQRSNGTFEDVALLPSCRIV